MLFVKVYLSGFLRYVYNMCLLSTRRILENNKFVILLSGVLLNKRTHFEGRNKIYQNTNIQSTYIGYGSYIGPSSTLNFCKIGKFCSIGPRVRVVQGFHPSSVFVSTHPAFYSKNIQAGFTFVSETSFEEYKYCNDEGIWLCIGNDVWIGSDVIILSGVKIHDGAIIASGSIITKDVGSYQIWGGNPAKYIKMRFSEDQVIYLKSVKWWDNDFEHLKGKAKFFKDIENFHINK